MAYSITEMQHIEKQIEISKMLFATSLTITKTVCGIPKSHITLTISQSNLKLNNLIKKQVTLCHHKSNIESHNCILQEQLLCISGNKSNKANLSKSDFRINS